MPIEKADSHPKTTLIVLTHSLQAQRLVNLLSSELGRSLASELRGKSEVLFLEWPGSQPHSASWFKLQQMLDVPALIHFTLPRHPNYLSFSKKEQYLKFYERLLNARPALERIFFLSYFSHYSYLAQLSRLRSIRLELVEEGLATYKGLNESFSLPEPTASHQFLYISFVAVRDVFLAFHEFFREIRALILRPNTTVRAVPQGFRDFDVVYSRFPEVASVLFPTADVVDIAPGLITANTPDRRGHTSAFFGQAYPLSPEAFLFLLRKMLVIASGPILVCPHPRANSNIVKNMREAVKRMASDRLSFAKSGLGAEELIRESTMEYVFSLTSTVLMEAKLWDSGAKTVSLAEELLGSGPRIARRARRLLVTDHETLTAFFEKGNNTPQTRPQRRRS